MYPKRTIVGFSGHRKLASPETALDGIRGVLERLVTRFGSIAAVCSAASGGDTLFLTEITRRKLPFNLILPFTKERFKRDFTTTEWQCVLPFFEQALSIQEIVDAKSEKDAYLQTGLLTVKQSDVMIFLWNGRPSAGLGGTGDVVLHARKINKPLIIIEPQTGTIEEEWIFHSPK